MADLVSYLAAGLVLIAAMAKFCSIRPARPTPAQRHLLVALAAFAPAHACAVQATQAATASIDPFPFATNLLSHSLAMVAGNSLVLMLAHTLTDRVSVLIRARWRTATAVLVGAVLVMSVLLVTADVEFRDGDFASVSARHATLVAYQLVFLGWMSFCAGRFILLLRRYLSRPDVEPVMRWGMRMVILGASVGLVWLGWSAATMIMARTGAQLVSRPAVVAETIGAVSVTGMALGSTLSVYGAWVPTARRRRVTRALCDLTPLWRLVADVLPEITLRSVGPTDPEYVLYRRVIEIRDAQVRLTRHVPPDRQAAVNAAATREADTDDRNAVRAEAAMLAVAIDAYQAGCPPADSAAINDPSTAVPDVLIEAHRLIQVYTALRDDQAVARILRRARQQHCWAPPADAGDSVPSGGIRAALTQAASLGCAAGWPVPGRREASRPEQQGAGAEVPGAGEPPQRPGPQHGDHGHRGARARPAVAVTSLRLPQVLADLTVIHRLERPLPIMYVCYAAWGASFASGQLVRLANTAVLLAIAANLLLIVGGLALNTAVDIRTDQRDANKSHVASAALRFGPGRTLRLAGAELAAAVACASGTALLTGRWIVPGLALTAALLQIMYNIEPVRLKRRGFVGAVAFGLAVVGLPFLVGHYAVAPDVSTPLWPIIIGVTALAIGRTAWWAVPDRQADRATGVATPPVRHGPGRTLVLACLIMLAGLMFLTWGLCRAYGAQWAAPGIAAHAIVLVAAATPLVWRNALPAVVMRRRGITVVALGEVILAILSLIA